MSRRKIAVCVELETYLPWSVHPAPKVIAVFTNTLPCMVTVAPKVAVSALQ